MNSGGTYAAGRLTAQALYRAPGLALRVIKDNRGAPGFVRNQWGTRINFAAGAWLWFGKEIRTGVGAQVHLCKVNACWPEYRDGVPHTQEPGAHRPAGPHKSKNQKRRELVAKIKEVYP